MQSCALEEYGETSEATTTVDAALQKGDAKDWLTVESIFCQPRILHLALAADGLSYMLLYV